MEDYIREEHKAVIRATGRDNVSRYKGLLTSRNLFRCDPWYAPGAGDYP